MWRGFSYGGGRPMIVVSLCGPVCGEGSAMVVVGPG